jgi:hypothetical protein
MAAYRAGRLTPESWRINNSMLKSLAKNLAYGVVAGSRVPRLLHTFGFPGKLTIVTYHAVVRPPLVIFDSCFIDEITFRNQLLYLKNHFTVLPLSTAVEALKLGKIDRPTAVITFDDGYTDFKDFAWPLLKQYGFSATVFLVSNQIGGTNHWDEYYREVLPLMDWPDILLLQKEGIEFGSMDDLRSSIHEIGAEVSAEIAVARNRA